MTNGRGGGLEGLSFLKAGKGPMVDMTVLSVRAVDTTVSVPAVDKTSERSNRREGHEERCGRMRQIG